MVLAYAHKTLGFQRVYISITRSKVCHGGYKRSSGFPNASSCKPEVKLHKRFYPLKRTKGF